MRLIAPSYADYTTTTTLATPAKQVDVSASLTPNFSTITLETSLPQAILSINEEEKGTGSWQGTLMTGTYSVQASLAGHRPTYQTIEVKPNTPQTITLQAPTPIYGSLNINAPLPNVEVFIDDVSLGTTPNIFSHILVGEHKLTLSKEGYTPIHTTVEINEGKITAYTQTEMLEAIKVFTRQDYIDMGSPKECVIPVEYTEIGDKAFAYYSRLTSITIPNSVTSIGYNAFAYCRSLTSITIPNSVTSIGEGALMWCDKLAIINVVGDQFVYSEGVLYNKDKTTIIQGLATALLNQFTIPNSVTSIGEGAFSFCSSLTSITIPNSVTSIGEGAFSRCDKLAEINIVGDQFVYSEGVLYNKDKTTIIQGLATALPERLIIPNSVTSIGYGAFWYCESLISITIPNSVTSIGENAFTYCKSLTSITIPNSVTSIEKGAFSSCSSLTSITIPNSVASIGTVAFWGCSSLTSITIPNSVTSIGSFAFSSCSSLTSITIPNSVTSIGDNAFEHCDNLRKINISPNCPVYKQLKEAYGKKIKKLK